MQISNVTERFLKCLDQLVSEGKVRSKRHFALTLGYHAQGLSEMTASRRDVPLELIEKAVHNFKINPNYLFTGTGKPFLLSSEEEDFRLKQLVIATDDQGEERIVHVPCPAQAGYGQQHKDPVFISELPTCKLPGSQFKSGSYRSFEISGNSMEPTYKHQDIVVAAFVEPKYWEQALKNESIFVIVTTQDVYIKRVINRLRNERKLDCISDNEEFQSFSVDGEEIREIWKPRMRITPHSDFLPSSQPSSSISEQLKLQKKMLESLQHQVTSLKTLS